MNKEQSSWIWKARADLSKAVLSLQAAKIDANAPETMALSRAILTLTETSKKLRELLE